MWLPKLEFENRFYSESKGKRLWCFINRNLPLHKAPVIETLRLKFYFEPEDVKRWIVMAVSRYVRELEITCFFNPPSCLYTCESLVILKLKCDDILLDVPQMACLPALKTLQLDRLVHFNEESLQRLLSSCPILEDLVVEFCSESDDMRKFSIIVPSLQSLYISGYFEDFVINTPSLKYFKLEDQSVEFHSCVIEHMPKLREAYVDVAYLYIDSFIGSITSVKSLTLCVKYSGLKDHNDDFVTYWNKPAIVPECISSNLQFFNWPTYLRSPDERKLLAYILKNARCLKKATILSDD